MTTFEKLYRQMLNEVYESELKDVPSWVTGGKDPADIMQENDSTMYRCGFSDWTDSLRDNPPRCDDCGDRDADIDDVCMDDEVLCRVCKCLDFVCEECHEDIPEEDRAKEGEDICKSCAEELAEAEKENDGDE